MPTLGSLGRSRLGADELVIQAIAAGITTFTMATLNNCIAFRFQAPDARDVYSVWVYWHTVSAPGTVTLRIETIDTTTGKPSGSLYDANATLTFTPTAGWQQLTFASHPTTNLTAGNEYAILLITASGGTTQTLRGYYAANSSVGNQSAAYPCVALTAADGSTRSNLAEVTSSVPTALIDFSDGSEECLAMAPWGGNASSNSAYEVFGKQAVGMVFKINNPINVAGIEIYFPIIRGTPDDSQFQILDSSNVQKATVTVKQTSLTNVNNRNIKVLFGAVVTLPAGTYRAIWNTVNKATISSNSWALQAVSCRTTATMPGGAGNTNFYATLTADVTLGSPTWTDTTTDQPLVALILDGQAAVSAGGGAQLVGTGGLVAAAVTFLACLLGAGWRWLNGG